MRVVAIEEHFTVPALVGRIDPAAISRRGFRPRKPPVGRPNPMELLPDIGERRLKSMDEAGITMQVLSNTGPGPDLVPGADGVAMAREMNDHLAQADRAPSRPVRGLCRAADAEPGRLRRRTGARRQGAEIPRRADQRHDRGPLPRPPEL